MAKKKPVYRDGKLHVQTRMCATCIFRPGNVMQLHPGRVESMIQAAAEAESCIPCHKTTYGQDKRGEAICRGFYEKHATMPIKIARAMGIIEFQ